MSEAYDETAAEAFIKFVEGPRVFVRVYALPLWLVQGFCVPDPVQVTFLNVDWFEVPADETREKLEAFIRTKRYFWPERAYLVLGDDPRFTFTIGEVRR